MAKTVTVFRVQNRAGRGPYRPAEDASETQQRLADDICRAHADFYENGKHPAPCDDGIGHIDDHEVCGFATLRELEDWFAGYMTALARASYWIVEYTVPRRHVRYGRQQLVFDPRLASFVQKTRPH